MKHKFSDIEFAFDSVSFQAESSCTAFLSRDTGKFYYLDDGAGVYDELPDDFETSDAYIEIPHKNDLDLGTRLVHRFINESAPEHSNEVREIFSRKGAYSRYRDFLDRNGLCDSWHEFEQNEITKTLKQWCDENEIDLDAASSSNAG